MKHAKSVRLFGALAGLFVLAAATCVPSDAEARRGAPPRSHSRAASALGAVSVEGLAAVDAGKRLAEDEAAGKGAPLRFAMPTSVSLSPDNAGTAEILSDGSLLWRLRVSAPGATDLNFGFSEFELPPGATLHVWSEDYDYYEGPYTAADHDAHGQLWTPMIPGDRAVVELWVPADADGKLALELTHIGRGYRDALVKGFARGAKSGSCNNDVLCPEADAWRDQIRSVAVYSTGGSLFCTGTLLMNVPGDFRNYFLTADHCGIGAGNAPSMVVYWNFESPSCGQQGGGSLADNQTGAVFRAGRADVDMTLVELDDDPDESFGVFYAGWDRSGDVPNGSVGIHHPNTDEKAISFNDDPLSTVDSCIGSGGVSSHWEVDDWEDGTTEPGSSGSALFDPVSQRVIGFLSGGTASCATPLDPDCYGKMSVAWDGASPSTRLRDWLDPGATGAMGVDGADPAPRLVVDSFAFVDSCLADPGRDNLVVEPDEEIELTVTLRATGPFTAVTGTLTSSDPNVTVMVGTASWPDLGTGESAAQAAPFRVLIDAGTACFSKVALDLSVSAFEDGPFESALGLDVGEDSAPDVPQSIPDDTPAGVASTLEIASGGSLTDVDVRVDVSHTFVGDLAITLESPAGTVVQLLDRPGVSGSGFGCGDEDMDVTFDDGASLDPESHCAGTVPWLSGSALPTGDLADFDGESPVGTWTLTVSDHAGSDTGSLIDWDLLTQPPVGRRCLVCGGPTTTTSTTTTTTSTTTTTLPVPLCEAAPASGCAGAGRAVVQIKDKDGNDRDQLKWKLARVDALDQSELGSPETTTTYALCLYDESGGVPGLVASYTIDPGPAWSDRDPRGFAYKDNDGASDGIRRVQLKTGAAGKAKVQVQGKGASLALPGPFDASNYFELDGALIVQLQASTGAICWSSSFDDAATNRPDAFKAKAE